MSDQFLGEVKIVPFNYAPKGWALCNGQLLPISQNVALFSLLGTTYGGDGVRTFALPDLRGASPMHASATHPLGERGGEEVHTLLATELPAHSHILGAIQSDASSPEPSGRVPAYASEDAYAREGSPAAMNPSSLTPGGGSQPHENRQPYLVLNFVIALQGIFPSRN